jgi:large subunit ribosomal protein L9
MKVVLNQDIKGVGKKHQLVEVSEGYARNFLLPKKLASVADNKNINESKNKISSIQFKKQTELEQANELKVKIEKEVVKLKHKTGENGRIFGSVTEKEIADEINKKIEININKKKIVMKNPIKQLGTYEVSIKLYEGVIAKIKVVVEV